MSGPSTRTATARYAGTSPGPICATCLRRRRCWPCAWRCFHNLYFYNKLTQRIRQALDEGQFAAFRAEYSEKLSGRL